MSGILSLYREFYFSLYKGQTPPNTVFWACVQIAFVIAALLAWGQEHYKWRALVTGRPELVIPPQGCYVDERRFTFTDTPHPEAQNSWVETTTIQAMASCLLLRITNDPKMPVDQANAKGIGAVITILNDIGKELFSFDARWADTSQPFTRQTGQSRFDLLSVDIPIGKTREVDIAFKFLTEESSYGFNNDSYDYPKLQNPQRRLSQGRYVARVRVRGSFVDKRWDISFINNGVNRPLEIIECKKSSV